MRDSHPLPICLLFSSKSLPPSAWKIPAPASLVALPPRLKIICEHPLLMAWFMDNPVPYVDVIPGFLFFSPINDNPDAWDSSTQAVFEFLNLKYSLKILFPTAFSVSCLTALPSQFFF